MLNGSKTYLRTLGIEVFKALNNFHLAFIEEIFHGKKELTYKQNNTQVNAPETAKNGDKILRILCPHIGIHSLNIREQNIT